MQIVGDIINAIINVHPWHSPLVHFPIGFTAIGLIFFLLAFWRGKTTLSYAAFLALGLAAIGTAAAGLTGLRDNIVRFEGGAPLIPAKIILGVLLLILTAATASKGLQRLKTDAPWQSQVKVLYGAAFAVSFGLSLVLGFLGGVIVYGI